MEIVDSKNLSVCYNVRTFATSKYKRHQQLLTTKHQRSMTDNVHIIEEAFGRYRSALVAYAFSRIKNMQEAEDIVQDAFVRLMGYDVITAETVKSLCYTIVSNIVIDHIRRHYKRNEVSSYIYDMEVSSPVLTPEQVATFHDLAEQERCLMASLSPSTRRVYEMTRHEELSIGEIAEQLGLSTRTVECHQFKARKAIRCEMRRII